MDLSSASTDSLLSNTTVGESSTVVAEREHDGRQSIFTVMGNSATLADDEMSPAFSKFIERHDLENAKPLLFTEGVRSLSDLLLLEPADYQHFPAVPRRKLDRVLKMIKSDGSSSNDATADQNPFTLSWFRDGNATSAPSPPPTTPPMSPFQNTPVLESPHNPFEVGNSICHDPFEVAFGPVQDLLVLEPPQNPFGVGNLNCHDPSRVAITTPQNPFEVGLSPHNPFEVGSDLPLEENSSQTVPTNVPALQIKGSLPSEFASSSRGGSVGHAFERQQEYVQDSVLHTHPVSVLGKTGPDPQIKPQLVGASGTIPNVASLDNISSDRPFQGEGSLKLQDLQVSNDDSSERSDNGSCDSWNHITDGTNMGLRPDTPSTIIVEPAASFDLSSKFADILQTNCDSESSEDDSEHNHDDKVRPKIFLTRSIHANTLQMVSDIMEKFPNLSEDMVNHIVNISLPHVDQAVSSTEARFALDYETCKAEDKMRKQATKQSMASSQKCIVDLQQTNYQLMEQREEDRYRAERMQEAIDCAKSQIATLNKGIVSTNSDKKAMRRKMETDFSTERNGLLEKLHIASTKYQSLIDVEDRATAQMESMANSLKASHDEEITRMRKRYAGELANSATERDNEELTAQLAAAHEVLESFKQDESFNNVAPPVDKDILSEKVSLGTLKSIWSSPSEQQVILRQKLQNMQASRTGNPVKSVSTVSPLFGQTKLKARSLVYEQSKAYIRNFFKQRTAKKALIEKANRGATEAATKAIGEIGGDSKANYTNFQMGENIANGLKKQLESELIDMLCQLDQTVLTKSSKAIHDLQPMNQLPVINPGTEAIAIAKLVCIFARDNLISMYPIYSDIVFLIESYDTTTGLFSKPRHCKSNGYDTIQDDEERDAYSLASNVLHSEVVKGLSNQPTRLTTAQTMVQYGNGKFQTTAVHEDGVQLLFSLLCSILKDVGDVKQTMIKEFTVCAEAQFGKFDPSEVVAALSDLVTQANNMGEGRPKIPYDQCIGTIALMLIFREPNFDSFLKDWKQCPDANFIEDGVPLIRGFYSAITSAVASFRKVKSFDGKSFWARSAQAIDVTDANDRKLISKYETAYSATKEVSFEDHEDDAEVKPVSKRRGKTRANKSAAKPGFCQAKSCPGRKGSSGEGNAIGKQHLAWKPDSQLCSNCFFHCVKQETDIPLTDGTVFKYIAKPRKSNTDDKYKKFAKFALSKMQGGSRQHNAFMTKVQTLFPKFESPHPSSKVDSDDNRVEQSLDRIQRLTAELADAEEDHESCQKRGNARTARASMQSNIDRINSDEKNTSQTKSALEQRQTALSDELLHVEAVLAEQGYSAKRTTA